MTDFFFIRHGESLNNRLGLVNGWTDCPLTELGIQQAQAAANILAKYPLNRIYTSDLQRARVTAEIIAKGHPNTPEVIVINGLRERNWGMYEDKPKSNRPPINSSPENGESMEDFVYRIRETLAKLELNKHSLLAAHAGVHRALYHINNYAERFEKIGNATPIFINVKTGLVQSRALIEAELNK